LRGFSTGAFFGHVARPVYLAVFEVEQVDFADRRLLVDQRFFSVPAPVIGRVDGVASSLRPLSGCTEGVLIPSAENIAAALSIAGQDLARIHALAASAKARAAFEPKQSSLLWRLCLLLSSNPAW
jgi:hypothetical protein